MQDFVRAVIHAVAFLIAISGPTSIAQQAQTAPKTSDAYRNVNTLRFQGLETIPADLLIRKIGNLPEVVEALHPSIDDSTFRFRVRDAISRGLLSSGFLDRRVSEPQTGPTDGTLGNARTFTVSEGPRYHRGDIRVTGSSEASNTWVAEQLRNLRTEEKESKPVWAPGKNANGTVLGRLALSSRFRGKLNQMGLAGDRADLRFVHDKEQRLVHIEVRLSKQDTMLVVPPARSATQKPALAAPKTSDAPPHLVGIAAELDRIFAANFSTPQPGFIVTRSHAQLISRVGFGRDLIWIDSQIENHRSLDAVIRPTGVAVSLDSPENAWRLQGVDVALNLEQRSIAESNGRGTMNLNFAWEVSSKTSDTPEPKTRGIRFTREGWTEWFPPQTTSVTSNETGKRYTFGNRVMQIDHEGLVLTFRGLDSDGNQLQITRATADELEQEANRLVASSKAREILVRDPSGHQTSVSRVVSDLFAGNSSKHGFFIRPANGNKSLFGLLLLSAINEEKFAKKESLICRLLTLYALHISAHQRHFANRLDELAPDSLRGPITALALADLAQRSGNLDRAVEYYSAVSLLSRDEAAVRRDLELLFNDSNLLGQLAQSIDIKACLQLAIQIAKATESTDTRFLEMLVMAIPDSNDNSIRRENTKTLVQFLYEAKYRQTLEAYCHTQREEILLKQEKLAAKRKRKKDQENKKKVR